ncbi:DUF3747 domain-containing protein [Romeria aff. gracilis LEGE 07310]|uniref:DUF3747 domain-containing protein n=1 Tax=Vasconcelosia minhoensis LEGE 07310 TaxID=915328 RepID=A0A8J7ATV6_9CYAN|nr:DUF3747 domain-containing protein [Romeria gracilis]MBE9076503.1 DUF3747 domain-containing protein [Romeria aff. gracilis LEGE 07310]
MKSAICQLTALTTAILGSAIAVTEASAGQFGQQAIDSGQIVAVAEPVDDGRFYQLLLLQQLSDERDCWREQTGTPTTIEPLLLAFDFSGICGRSGDSNGYSLRIGGEDFNSRYRLEVVQRGDDLVLLARPGRLTSRSQNLPTLELGRSQGSAMDFVKLELNPSWQLTRRTYNGQPLGHIYVTSDQSFETVAQAAVGTAIPGTSSASAGSVSADPTLVAGIGGIAPSTLIAQRRLPRTREPLPTPPDRDDSPGRNPRERDDVYYQVVVPSSSAILRRRVQAVEPRAFQTTLDGQQVMQVGLFQDEASAEALRARLVQANLNARVVQGRGAIAAPPTPPTAPATPSPAPRRPTSPSAQAYYQVIVPNTRPDTLNRVRAIESSAFRATVNGQSVVQVGIFREQARAELIRDRLSQANLSPQIITSSTPPSAGPPPVASTPRTPSPSIPRPRQGQLTVVIDPGHGGRDPGAIGIGGLREKDINIFVSRRVQERLADRGIQALLTRSSDVEIDLEPRVDFADRANADIFVSIHANAISLSRPEVNGLETYYYSSGLRLAQTIHNTVLRETDIRDRGVRQARFYVLRNTSMPAVLVETGFVTGSEDAARFRNDSELRDLADAIADGILQYLGVQ